MLDTRRAVLLVVAACLGLVAENRGVPDPGPPLPASAAQADQAELPDLMVASVSRVRVDGDWQSLVISGTVAVDLTNGGDGGAGPFDLALFEDADADGRFDPAVDRPLGSATVAGLAAGEMTRAIVAVSGSVTFRDNLIYALADSADAVPEKDEGNNSSHTGLGCAFRPPVGAFEPSLEWEWTGSSELPASHEVMMTPAVIDLDGNGIPDVVFSTYQGRVYESNGVLRAVRGNDGSELFSVTDPRYRVAGEGSVAVGDIDGDHRPEIVAVDETGKALMAFEDDGTFKWRSPQIQPYVREGGASIADLDGDGVPEIVVGSTVLNNDGTARFSPRPGARGRGDNGWGPLSVVADIDLDGTPEILAGNTAYSSDGRVLWQARIPYDAFDAVANFDTDPFPEIVMVSGGDVYLVDHDGRIKWGPHVLPGANDRGSGGPPTIADVDGDGWPEIGVAGGRAYTVIETNGSTKWSQTTQDLSSAVTGSSVFDFEGDGSAEVVYGDELRLRIYRGRDGAVLWDVPRSDGTTYDMPLVVDVDGDGNAEIVSVSNELLTAGSHGVQVYGDRADSWVPTRQLWNQHAYHIDNINDDGSVPAVETPSWLDHNTYRTNLPPGRNPFAAPDVTASRIVVDQGGLPQSVTISVRVGNGGAIVAPVGLPIAFYDGDPTLGGVLIGVTPLPVDLAPGRWVDVSYVWRWPRSGQIELYASADDDGTGHGTANECVESNNVHHVALRVAPTPTPTPSDTPGHTPSSTPTASATETSGPSATVLPTSQATQRPTTWPTPTASLTEPPSPWRLYLPVALDEPRLPKRAGVDVALVVDASSSMSGVKLALAKDAARTVVGLVSPDLDRVALVAFSGAPRLAVPLTGDLAWVSREIAGITSLTGTGMDLGLDAALAELEGPRGTPGHRQVLVLLSDGRPSVPASAVLASANRARDRGVQVLTIGFGEDTDSDLLAEIAGGAQRYRHEPSASALEEVFRGVAGIPRCDPAAFWGRRCP